MGRPSPTGCVPLRRCEWVVYAKRPFAGPAAVLAYLSRYTHRVAISNRRLVAMDERGVTFRWKDYRAKGRTRHKTMTLSADEFMRRFLLHVLPSGFHRIRHYGLIANARAQSESGDAAGLAARLARYRLDRPRPRGDRRRPPADLRLPKVRCGNDHHRNIHGVPSDSRTSQASGRTMSALAPSRKTFDFAWARAHTDGCVPRCHQVVSPSRCLPAGRLVQSP
jgi:hypothetical protein